MILSLVLPIVLSGAADATAAAVLVGVRTSGQYRTVAFTRSPAGGFSALSRGGLLAFTDAGLMLVDVVENCEVAEDRYLVVKPAGESKNRVRCLSRPDSGGPGEGRGDASVVFVSSRYVSVGRYWESWNGRGSWSLSTRRWGQGTALPMPRVLPKDVVAAVDGSANARKEAGIADALRQGMVGDADPCWYGDASRASWGIVRSDRRWVVLAQLESECATNWFNTRVPVPGDLVDDLHNHKGPALVSGLPETTQDLAVSPDGRLAVIIEGSSMALWSVREGVASSLLAERQIGAWREDSSGAAAEARDAMVMVQWLSDEVVAKWSAQLQRELQQE